MATSLPIQPYLNKDRVINLTDPESCICPLCEGILWLPNGCKNCDTPYCLSCIKNRESESSEPIQCPSHAGSESSQSKCSGFMQYRCSNHVLRALSKLTVKCRYEVYGCKETPSYTHLETHEEICGYQQKMCSGCQKEFALIDFQAHESTCPLVILNCSECNTRYKREDRGTHTETKCLREQLIQVRAIAENGTKSLHEQLIQERAISESETKSLCEQLIEMRVLADTESKSLLEQLIQVRVIAESETKSLREQLHDLQARVDHLENQQNSAVTDPINSAVQNSNESVLTEASATAS